MSLGAGQAVAARAGDRRWHTVTYGEPPQLRRLHHPRRDCQLAYLLIGCKRVWVAVGPGVLAERFIGRVVEELEQTRR